MVGTRCNPTGQGYQSDASAVEISGKSVQIRPAACRRNPYYPKRERKVRIDMQVIEATETHVASIEIPPVMAQELKLIHLAATTNGCDAIENIASLYARLCSIGLDVVLKEYGARRFRAKASEVDALIPITP